MDRANQRVVLITGASSGFGRSVAEALLGGARVTDTSDANDGRYIVCAAARRVDMMHDLADRGALVLALDVASAMSCKACVEAVLAKYGRIDILINSAGFGSYGTIEDITIDQARYQFDVNVFGAATMIQNVLPTMRSQRRGMIINLSSLVGDFSMAGLGWYAATKHAIEALSVALRQEVKRLGIKVVMIKPGTVRTGFEDVMLDNIDKLHVSDDYTSLMAGFRQMNVDMYRSSPGPQRTVNAILKSIRSYESTCCYRYKYRTTFASKLLPRVARWLGAHIIDTVCLKLIFRSRSR